MKRIVVHVLGGLVVACTVALPAVAAERPNDRAGLLGVGAVTASAGTDSAPPPESSGRPDGREGPDGADVPRMQPMIVAAGDGFDWSDAGIGLAGGIGIVLVLAGALATAQHARHVPS